MKACLLGAALLLAAPAAAAESTGGPAPTLPTWREGPTPTLPPTPTGRARAGSGGRDTRKLVVVGGGLLVIAGLLLYNRRAKAALAERLAREDADDR